jgi:hypothetical protein
MRRRKRRGEVNLHDCLMMLVVLLAGLFVASYGAKHFGWAGFLLGIPVGLIVAFGVLYAVAFVAACLEALLWEGMPMLPPCGNGKCKSGLLTDFGDFEPEEVDGEFGYFRCRCGKLYFRDRKKGRVAEVLADGTHKPYMVWKPFRGWRPDEVGKVKSDGAPTA